MTAMTWLFVAVVIAILAATAAVASGRWGEMPDVVDDRPSRPLPDGQIGAEELREVRFSVVPRGYSMAQVDELLRRLARQFEASGAGAGAAATDLQTPAEGGTRRDAAAIAPEDAE